MIRQPVEQAGPPLRVLLPLLLAAALLAGCTMPGATKDEPVQQASTTATPSPTTRASDAPPPVSSTSPPPSTSTPPPPSTSTPPPPTTTPTPPAKRADEHAEAAGWVNASPGEAFVKKLSFQAFPGAKNVSAAASVVSRIDPVGPAPAQLANFSITILDPEGKVVKRAAFGPENAPAEPRLALDLNATSLGKSGDYVLELRIERGLSDGSSVGDRFLMTLDVKY